MRRIGFIAAAAAFALPAGLRAQQAAPPPPPSQGNTAAQEYQDRYEQERREYERDKREDQRDSFYSVPANRRGEGIQVQGIPETELTAVLHQLDVKDGEMTVRLRFYNDGPEDARLRVDPAADYESFFVQVGREKLFILRDDDGDLDAKKPLDVELRPGKMESWWAKFPAPAAGTETFDLAIPPATTFRSVELED